MRAIDISKVTRNDSTGRFVLEGVLLQDHPLFVQVLAFSWSDVDNTESQFEIAQHAFMRQSLKWCDDCPRFSFGPGFASFYWFGEGKSATAQCEPNVTCWVIQQGYEYQHDANVLVVGNDHIPLVNPANTGSNCSGVAKGVGCFIGHDLAQNSKFGLLQDVVSSSRDPNAKYELRPSIVVDSYQLWVNNNSAPPLKLTLVTWNTSTYINDNVALGIQPVTDLERADQVRVRYRMVVFTKLKSPPVPGKSRWSTSFNMLVGIPLATVLFVAIALVTHILHRRRRATPTTPRQTSPPGIGMVSTGSFSPSRHGI